MPSKESFLQKYFGLFSFHYLYNKYLSAYNVPKTALNTVVNKTSQSLPSKSLEFSGGVQILYKDEYESNIGYVSDKIWLVEGGGNQGRGNMKNKLKFLSRASRVSLAEKVISEYSNNLKEMSTIILFFLNYIMVIHWWTKHPDCLDFANCEFNKGIF